MKLFDTATQSILPLRATSPVLMYVCGITPYDSAHLGHAFTFLTYDLLRRRIEDDDTRVRMVRNITDVDEPMYTRAAELGVHYLELARSESAEFTRMMSALNLEEPEAEPRPSDHIDAIVEAVQGLKDGGHAYQVDGDIYFDIASFAAFGSVSHYTERLMTGLAPMRGGDPERPGKRQPLDFLLWKSVTDPDDPAQWDTRIGNGRPGWHIECTAMSYKHLGGTIDIHGGGTDLVFPHHECENAQSSALRSDTSFVGHWVHTSPLGMGGEKMSKSLGNLVFVRDLVKHTDPAAVRIALMQYHYRMGGEWRPELLYDANQLLTRVMTALQRPAGADVRPHLARVRAALDDDLNAPEAVRVLREMTDAVISGDTHADAAGQLREAVNLLGIKPAEVPR